MGRNVSERIKMNVTDANIENIKKKMREKKYENRAD